MLKQMFYDDAIQVGEPGEGNWTVEQHGDRPLNYMTPNKFEDTLDDEGYAAFAEEQAANVPAKSKERGTTSPKTTRQVRLENSKNYTVEVNMMKNWSGYEHKQYFTYASVDKLLEWLDSPLASLDVKWPSTGTEAMGSHMPNQWEDVEFKEVVASLRIYNLVVLTCGMKHWCDYWKHLRQKARLDWH